MSNLIEQHNDIERDYRQTRQEYQKLQASLEDHQTSTATIADDDYNQLLAHYNAWEAAVKKYQREQDILDAAQLKTRQELAGKQAQLTTLQGRTGIIDDNTTAATRKKRDALWQTHLQQLDESTATAFKQALDDDDILQQQRFEHTSDLATLHNLQLDISQLEAASTEQQQQAVTLQATKSALCDAISISLEQNSVAVLEGQEDTQLDMVLQQFKHFLENANQQRIIQKEKQAQAAKDLITFKERQADFELAEQNLHNWQQQWQVQLSRCWLDNAANPIEVKETLNILQEVKTAFVGQNKAAQTLKTRHAQQDNFAASFENLCTQTGQPYNLQDAAKILQHLRTSLQDQQTNQKLQQQDKEQLAIKEESSAALEQQANGITLQQQDMECFFGVEGFTAILQQLADLKKRADFKQQQQEQETAVLDILQLKNIELANDQLETFSIDLEARRDELAALENKSPQLQATQQEAYSQQQQAVAALNALDSDAKAARLEQQQQTLILEIQEKAEDYLRLKFGIASAEYALRQYRDKHQSSMLQHASEAFKTITQGRYKTLRTATNDKGEERLLAIENNGASKAVQGMSKGTAMQLYLALRIAGYYEFIKQGRPSLPFVADDILETFDDNRTAETLKLMHQLSQKGQVIFLTHHEHLCDIAKTVCHQQVKIHDFHHLKISSNVAF